MTNASTSAVDYDALAASFDAFLPIIEPVTARLIDHLDGLTPGALVLDIACGTGEPGLTLLERHPGVRLLGVDSAEAMVAIARTKVAARGLTGAEHTVMNSQQLTIEDATVDAAVSRFGLLSFADPHVEATELARVLRPGAAFSLATWDATSKNIITYAAATAARAWLPPQFDAMMQRQEQSAMPGRRAAWLTGAGLSVVNSELFTWPVEFPDEPTLWTLATGPAMLGAVIGTLTTDQLSEARATFTNLLADYRHPNGSYTLPYACQILWGAR